MYVDAKAKAYDDGNAKADAHGQNSGYDGNLDVDAYAKARGGTAKAEAEAEETPAEGKKPATRKVHRDAKTGRFVTKQYAEEHPDTTVTETVE